MICPLRSFVTWLCSVEHWTLNSVGSGSTGRWYYLKSWYPPIISCFISLIYFLHPVDVINIQKVNQYFHPTQTTTIHLSKIFYCNSSMFICLLFSPGFPNPLHPQDFIFKFSLRRNSFLVKLCVYWHLWNLNFCKDKKSCHL